MLGEMRQDLANGQHNSETQTKIYLPFLIGLNNAK
jgi:hypothetical protein